MDMSPKAFNTNYSSLKLNISIVFSGLGAFVILNLLYCKGVIVALATVIKLAWHLSTAFGFIGDTFENFSPILI